MGLAWHPVCGCSVLTLSPNDVWLPPDQVAARAGSENQPPGLLHAVPSAERTAAAQGEGVARGVPPALKGPPT